MTKKPRKPRTAIRFSPFSNPPKMWQHHIQLVTTPTHKQPLPRPANRERGFSLVEAAMVMMLYGLFMASVLGLFAQYQAKQVIATNNARMTTITAALDTYRAANGH